MNSVTNILAAVGLFPQDDPVLARAAEIARSHQAKLTVVHVIDRLTATDPTSIDLVKMQLQMELVSRQLVETAVANHVVGVNDLDIRIETGSPSQRLSDLAKEINADLIVMRAHQSRSIVEKLIGSTTDRVIRTSSAPVLVVKRPAEQAYQRIVISINPADESRAIVPRVAALFPEATLSLLHAVYVPVQFEELMLRTGSGMASLAAHRDLLVLQAKACLGDLAKDLKPRSRQTITRVVVGVPAKTLNRATWNPKVDLIVLGPGRTRGIRQALLGSVTRSVLHNAACDVLVYRTTT